MKRKDALKAMLFLVMIILSLEYAMALGISVNKDVNYIPNTTREYQVCFRNSNDAPDPIKVTVEGPIADLITLNFPDVMTLGPKETSCNSYTVRMPETMELVGPIGNYIVATEIPAEASGGGIQFVVVVSVKHRFTMFVPYPGKYLQISLDASNVKVGEPVTFVVNGESKGVETIKKVTGEIEIYDIATDELVDKVRLSEAINIRTNDNVKLTGAWSTKGKKPGEYMAKANIIYDEKSELLETRFQVGSLNLEVIDHTKEAINNTINKFDIVVESNWNDAVSNVYADVRIKKGSYLAEFRTPPITVKPFGKGTISSYWETVGTDVGLHDLLITLHYANKVTTKEGKVNVILMHVEKPSPFNTTTLLIIIVILLAIFNIFWFVKSKLKEKKDDKNDQKKQAP